MNVDVSSTKVILGLIHDMVLAYCSPFVMLVVVKATGVNKCYWHARCREHSLITDAHSRSRGYNRSIIMVLKFFYNSASRLNDNYIKEYRSLVHPRALISLLAYAFLDPLLNCSLECHSIWLIYCIPYSNQKFPLPEVLTSLWRKI